MEQMYDKLDYVLILAEERNLTRAAMRLHISQPTLTQYINRLETELGVRLFDRARQPVTVTQAGLMYMEDMKKIRSRTMNLHAKLQLLQTDRQVFSIGVPAVRSEHLLPDILPPLLERYPEMSINVDVRLEEILQKELVNGTLDLIIGALDTSYPGIHCECIEEIAVYLVIPRSNPLVASLSEAEGTLEKPYLIDASQINGQRLLLPRIGGGQHQSAMRLIRRHGIVPGPIINCNNLNTLYRLASRGIGILFTTPLPFVRSFPQYTESFAFCTLQRELEYQHSYVGYREGEESRELIRCVLESLRARRDPRS